MAERPRIEELRERFLRRSLVERIFALTLAGIVLGVLLLATGMALLQLAGALLVVLGLLVARCGARLSASWWSDPLAQLVVVRAQLRRVVPDWTGSAAAIAALLLAAVWLARRVIAADGWSIDALEDLAKGAIGLAMLATLLLWRSDGFPLPRRHPERSRQAESRDLSPTP